MAEKPLLPKQENTLATGELATSALIPELVTPEDTDDIIKEDVIHVRLTPEIEEKFLKTIDEQMAIIQAERAECNFLNIIQENEDLYDGVVEPRAAAQSWMANYHLHLVDMMVDTGVIKACRQTLEASPIDLLEADEDFQISQEQLEDELQARQDRNDFRIRQVGFEKLAGPLYRNTFKHGTAIIKNAQCNEIETLVYLETYTKKEIPIFVKDFQNELLMKDTKTLENLAKLQALPTDEESITIQIEEDKQVYFGPKPQQIPLKNFWCRLSIHDLKYHTLIGDDMTKTWGEMCFKLKTDYYIKEKINKLKELAPNDYEKNKYKLMECRIKADIKDDGKIKKYVVTVDLKNRLILRAIYFPYKHNQEYYIPYYIQPRDDRFLGYGWCQKLKDNSRMIDNLWNIAFDTAQWANLPIIWTDDNTLNLTEQSYSPMSSLKVMAGKKVDVLKMSDPNLDTLNLIAQAQRFAEFITGVSALFSGRESSSDPNAPAAKTAILLKEANDRINDDIKNLQYSNALLFEQIEELDKQYLGDDLGYYRNGKRSVKVELMNKKVRHIPQGLSLTKNQDIELEKIMQFYGLMQQYYPEVLGDPEKKHIMLGIFMNAMGGNVERSKDKLNPSPTELKTKAVADQFKDIMSKVIGGMNGKVGNANNSGQNGTVPGTQPSPESGISPQTAQQ